MKKVIPCLLLVTLVANIAAQSGRRVTRPATQPLPPVQAPVFTPPEPEPESNEPATRAPLRALPDSVRYRPLTALDKTSFRLADFRDKVVVVNLWASWCGPCRREVPEYEKVRKEYAARNVEFIGLTLEDPRKAAKRVNEFVRQLNFGFRLGWADGETAQTLMNGSEAVPQTLVIAPDGRVISHWDGYVRGHSGDHLRASLERALSQSSEQ
jgi:thiol-disulfide isomerase/thioredoxin